MIHARRTLPAITRLLAACLAVCLGFAQGAPQPAPTAIPASRQATNIAIIPIRGEIDERSDGSSVMATSVMRRIDLAVRSGADAIVFELDTPGGGARASLRISKLIKQCPVRNTVAWIRPEAYSGGAIIALACREIVVAESASFGDAMPIAMDPAGAPRRIDRELLKKILPPLISDVLDSARRVNQATGEYQRDEYLCLALVANDVQLWYVRNTRTGARLCIDRAEFDMLFPGQSAAGPARLAGAPGTDPPGIGSAPGMPSGSDKLASIAPIVAADAAQLPSSRPVISPADAGNWALIEKTSDGTGAVVLTSEDMVRYRLAANAPAPPGSLLSFIPIATDQDIASFFLAKNVRRLEPSWSEGLVLVLTNIWVRGIILAVFLLAMFAELMHPGAGLPGAIAILALGLFIAPPMLIGMASWWEVAAIIAGVVLLAIEIFVTPGFGLPGILGLALLFGGLVATFVPRGSLFPSTQEAQSNLLLGVVTVLLAAASAGFGLWALARYFGSIPVLGRLVLKGSGLDDSEDLIASMGDPDAPAADIGEEGVALTPLRPAGRVLIGDRVLDAVAEFGYIPAQARVRVVTASPFRIGVEESGAAPPGTPSHG